MRPYRRCVSSPLESLPSALEALTDAVAARTGAAAVITAPSGAGKSVLLERVERRAARAGWLTGRAAPGRDESYVPYAAIRPLIEPAPAFLDSPTASIAETAHHLYRHCEALSRTRPLALFVDNAQWADRGSLRVLAQLARRTRNLPLLVVLATRPRETEGVPDVSAIFSAIAGVLRSPEPARREPPDTRDRDRLCGRLPRVPRHDDRQHRLPEHRRLVSGRVARGPLVGARRLLHRDRGAARAGRRRRRPGRSQACLPGGPRDLRHRLGGVRGGAALGGPGRRAGAAGRRRGGRHGRLAGADPAGVPARPARGGRRASGAPRRRSPRRSGPPLGGLLVEPPTGAGCSPSTCRSARLVYALGRRTLIESVDPRVDRPARSAGAGAHDRRPRAARARDPRGRRVGLGEPAHPRRVRRRGRPARADRAALPVPSAPGARSGAAADRELPAREPRAPAARDGVLLDHPRQRALPHRRLGLQHPRGRPRGRPRRDGDHDRRRPRRTDSPIASATAP